MLFIEGSERCVYRFQGLGDGVGRFYRKKLFSPSPFPVFMCRKHLYESITSGLLSSLFVPDPNVLKRSAR